MSGVVNKRLAMEQSYPSVVLHLMACGNAGHYWKLLMKKFDVFMRLLHPFITGVRELA